MSWERIHQLPYEARSSSHFEEMLRVEVNKVGCGKCRVDGNTYLQQHPITGGKEQWIEYASAYHTHVNKIKGVQNPVVVAPQPVRPKVQQSPALGPITKGTFKPSNYFGAFVENQKKALQTVKPPLKLPPPKQPAAIRKTHFKPPPVPQSNKTHRVNRAISSGNMLNAAVHLFA